jgi:3-phosphoshikimate 1-carboxyvinyltransferase
LAVLSSQINGRSEFHDAGELRVKESDRLRLITENLRRMGARVEAWPDGCAVDGPAGLKGAEIDTAGDHRIAMAFAVAGLAASGETVIDDAACAAVSYPEFWNDLRRLAPSSVKAS